MEKAFKYRIYPTASQRAAIKRTFGCVRFVYNHYIDLRRDMYSRGISNISYIDMVKDLNNLKQQFPWLRKIDSRALQNTLRDLDVAYKKFFSNIFKNSVGRGYPKYKDKNIITQSYKTTNNCNSIAYLGEFIKLPKLGKVRIRGKLHPEGRVLNATISQEPDGKYYVSLCCTDVTNIKFQPTGRRAYIAHGEGNCFAQVYEVASDGNMTLLKEVYIESNVLFSLKKYARVVRRLERAKEGSRGRLKLLQECRCLKAKIEARQSDFLHKLSIDLVKDYDVIDVGSGPEHVKGKLVHARWSQFKAMIKYKMEWYKILPNTTKIHSDVMESIP